MANPKITLSAGISPTEGGIGTYLISLDTPAPAGGLKVNYNTTGSTATFNDDYNFKGGDNLRAVTDSSFTITAGATSAILNLVAHTDGVLDSNEKVVVTLMGGAGYDIPSAHQFSNQTIISPVIKSFNSLTTADFNGDGNADLATKGGGTISVLLGDGKGNGEFTQVSAIDDTSSYYNPFTTTADFNNDGKMDLIVNNGLLLMGDGEGGFTVNSEFAKISILATVADLNGDGNADLLTGNWSSHTVSVRLGDGNGGFSANTTIKVKGRPYLITTADFNNDGKMDLAVNNSIRQDYFGKGDTVSVLLGDGKGGLTVSSTFIYSYVQHLVAADFDNDGNVDLAKSNYYHHDNSAASVSLGDGQGGFAAKTDFLVEVESYSLTTADFNGDGNADLATRGRGTISVLLGDGKGGFTGDTSVVVGGESLITTADFNNDGKMDLATAEGNIVSILLYVGDFSAGLTISDPANHPPTGAVMLNDFTPKLNQLLTVKNTLTDTDGLGPITYKWQANNVNIGTGNSYKVTGNEVGKAITVIASYIDGVGYTETISSKPVTVPLTASFTITPTTPQNTGENGKTASYSIHLNTAPLPNQNVVVTFTSSDTSEGVINNPTLSFTSANYATPQTLKIRGVNDNLDDGDIPYSVTAQVTTLDVFYKKLTIAPFNLTNTDDGLDKALDLKGDQGGSKIDVLSGGNGADTLYGLKMDDNLSGGINNDTLYGGYGDDNLFGENGDDQLFGEQGNDYMDGGAGNDVLSGGVGNDNLTGGSGQDSFLFDSALKANIDTITDFKSVDDSITLENLIFTKLTTTGILNADNFATATAAIDSNDYLVYNKTTGALFYDADGSGAGTGIQIAMIGSNLALTSADFVVI